MPAYAELKKIPHDPWIKKLLFKAEYLFCPLFPRVAADVGKRAGCYTGGKGAVPKNTGKAFVKGIWAVRGNND